MAFPRLSFARMLRPLAAVFGLCLVATAANYYMDFGWFGQRGRLVMSLTLLASCFFLILSQRTPRSGR
jgi:hypothetical protein